MLPFYIKSAHTQTLNSPRKVNRLDCWFYFIITVINQFIYFSIQHLIIFALANKIFLSQLDDCQLINGQVHPWLPLTYNFDSTTQHQQTK